MDENDKYVNKYVTVLVTEVVPSTIGNLGKYDIIMTANDSGNTIKSATGCLGYRSRCYWFEYLQKLGDKYEILMEAKIGCEDIYKEHLIQEWINEILE